MPAAVHAGKAAVLKAIGIARDHAPPALFEGRPELFDLGLFKKTCFIDNDADAGHLKTEEALQELAEAEAKGMMEFLTKQYAPGEG